MEGDQDGTSCRKSRRIGEAGLGRNKSEKWPCSMNASQRAINEPEKTTFFISHLHYTHDYVNRACGLREHISLDTSSLKFVS